MDPNETLLTLRRLASWLSDGNGNEVTREEAGRELAEAFESLDTWLSRGGFLPDEWRHARSGRSS